MKKDEIEVNGVYIAKVSNKLVPCQVKSITKREKNAYRKAGTVYACVNLDTGREATIRSAAKFRREVVTTLDGKYAVYKGGDGKLHRRSILLSESKERRLEQIESKYSTENGATNEEWEEAKRLVSHLNLTLTDCLLSYLMRLTNGHPHDAVLMDACVDKCLSDSEYLMLREAVRDAYNKKELKL